MALPVLGQIHDAEASCRQLGLERVDLLDVALGGVHEVLRLRVRRSAAGRAGTAR